MISNAMERIVVVGAGMTGAMTAALLRSELSSAEIMIMDKGRGTGGRMSTSRSNNVKNSSTVDLGAQYISLTKEYQIHHKRYHDELISNGLLVPLTGTIEGDRNTDKRAKHYVTPKGVGSLVKHFLAKSGGTIQTNNLLTEVNIKNDKIEVSNSSSSSLCDVLVLTMPVPQILNLKGNISQLIESKPDVKKKLETVSYSSRFALGLFYDQGTQLNYSWSGKYVVDNPCIRFIAIDDKKRGIDSSSCGPSVVVHTSVPFSLQNLETDKEDMRDVIMSHLTQVLPDLPQPAEIKSHKWRYSQVHTCYPGSPGCVVLNDKPLIILAGDGFTHSNLDGCIASALSVQRVISEMSKL